ncbi:MAG: DUF7064 domain-containing protein [Acidimicrobiia bacterium]
MDAIRVEDNGPHEPGPGADPRWQESWFLAWCDPGARSGGFHHVGLQRPAGRADVWSWLALDGEVVGKFQSLDLAPPDDDLPDLAIGGMQVVTKSPLRSLALSVEYPGARADVVYEAFTDPFSYTLDLPGADVAKGHYESVGRVAGTVAAASASGDSREVTVAGFAFQDHSWGPRNYSAILTHRWLWATFSDDLFCSIFTMTTAAGRQDFGYVHDAGHFHRVTRMDTGARVADDGHSPTGCDARIQTVSGRGYRITGTVDVASVTSHDDFFFTDGLSVFECGGRLGSGIFEVHELAGPAPWHRQALGL